MGESVALPNTARKTNTIERASQLARPFPLCHPYQADALYQGKVSVTFWARKVNVDDGF